VQNPKLRYESEMMSIGCSYRETQHFVTYNRAKEWSACINKKVLIEKKNDVCGAVGKPKQYSRFIKNNLESKIHG